LFFLKRDASADEYDNYGWSEFNRPPWAWYLKHVALLVVIASALTGVAWGFNGRGMAEKIVTGVVQPVGMIWAALSLLVYFSLLQKRTGVVVASAFCWIILTIAGNQYFSNWLVSTLEARYYHKDLEQMEPAEYGLLLGGGTATAPSTREQLNTNGDRLAVAAELYHAGRIKKIICSGSHSFALDDSKSPSEEAIMLLQRLGVPAEDLSTIEGANTFQEIENLQKWVASQRELGSDPGRVAVISSAWHLPRVQRLARARKLEITSVPADFLSSDIQPSAHMVVPGAYQLLISSQAIKEYLARLAGR
jgi:uncharacterized SAM-binding protein YcdF (DUF218 family)